MPAVRLQLLRTPQLYAADGGVHELSRLDAALLALLAVDGPAPRARLIALLWPRSSSEDARNSLRQRLFRLRRAAGRDLVASGERLALAAHVAHDVGDPQDLLAADPAGAAQGDLLGGFAYDDLLDFAAWLDRAREQWRSRRREVLAEMASRLEAGDHVAEALVCAERLARDEPLLEHAQRRLMRLHYRRGDRAAALAAYAHLREALQRHLDEDPSDETLALARQIESSGTLPVAAAPAGLLLLRPPRLVGREREWRRIDAALAERRVVFVAGEPGVGKSRLLGDFAAGWIAVAARPGDARVPFALLARLARALVDATGTLALDDWARAELARLLPALGAAATGRTDARRLQQALESLLTLAQPQGVAVDDLQFADDGTLELLPALAACATRWLFALRPHAQPAALATWLAALDTERVERIELAPLDQAAVAELLHSLALPSFDAAAWAPRIHRHSGGNPLFILETLRALPADPPGAGDALPLPTNLRQLIERRLEQLTDEALKLARIAAVAGPDFGVELAAAVLERHPLDLLDAWRELEAAQVMSGDAFAHDLIFEATRDSVPLPLRRWLHRRIAEWLAAHGGLAVRLALHWREAGEPARAAPCFAQAADEARRAGRLAEQTRWLQAAVDAHAQAGQASARFDAMVQYAIAAREALAPEQAQRAAAALLEAAADERQRGIAQLQRGACQLNAARFDVASAAFDAAIAAAEAAGDDDTAQHARYLQALATAQLAGPPAALARIEPLIGWAEAHHDPSLRHSFVADLAILYDQADQRHRARPLFERALAYFDRERETGNSAPTRMMFARSLVMLGDLARARELLEQAVHDRAELSEGDGGHGIEALNLGRVLVELGRYADTLALLQQWLERLAAAPAGIVRGAVALVLARVYAHLGQFARALPLLKEVPADAPFHQQAALHWTRALLAPERPAERARLLERSLGCFAATDLPFARLPIAIDRHASVRDTDALRGCIAECERRELPAAMMFGRLRLMQALHEGGEAHESAALARSIVDQLPLCRPTGVYLPELYAACRAAALAAGDRTLARHCHQSGIAWISDAARTQVPEPFRDSFAQRNPTNRALLTAAAP